MNLQRIVKIFLASPMDLTEERKIFNSVIEKINQFIGKFNHVIFEVIGWEEYAIPDLGEDAQDIVNRQIQLDYDIFVCLFKNRIGTPTKRAQSGTIEEYERAKMYRISRPDLSIMAYFFTQEQNHSEIDEVKKMMENDGALFWEVENLDIFENAVFRHFSAKLVNFIKNDTDVSERIVATDEFRMKNAVSVALVNQKHELLVVRRADNLKSGAGMWQLPGGKMETGENEEEAAVREIREELRIQIRVTDLQKVNRFQTFLSNDKTKPFTMTLFLCFICDDECSIALNDENSSYEWIDLKCYDLADRTFFGINERMILSVWREVFLTSSLRYLVEFTNHSKSDSLPKDLPALSRSQTNMMYAFLSLLGVVETGHGVRFLSEYSKKLIEELLYILSEGNPIFDNKQMDDIEDVRLPAEDMRQLSLCRERAFHSNQSLVAYLSCKANMPKGTRNICDTLIFGEQNGHKYLLMRWDFYADKYQIVCKGLPEKTMTYEDKARFVIAHRIPNTETFFHYQFVKNITVHHFSAGSVDNDPILRRYHIDIVHLNAIKKHEEDVLQAIRMMNAETYQELVFGLGISKNKCIEMKYYVWCNAEDLLMNPCNYGEDKVRGIEEILRSIGSVNFMELGKQAIQLKDEDLDPVFFKECRRLLQEKLRK